MGGANQNEARRQARYALKNSLSGKKDFIDSHIRRAEAIAEAVWKKWQVTPATWQVKHLRWFLTHHVRKLSDSRRYEYWLTVRVLIAAQHKFYDWEPHLKGPWQRPSSVTGELKQTGRPPRLPQRLRS